MIPREFPQQKIDAIVIVMLPVGTHRYSMFEGLEEAIDTLGQHYYYCPWCLGWLRGNPSVHTKDISITGVGGQCGTVYQCQKCMNEITFVSH